MNTQMNYPFVAEYGAKEVVPTLRLARGHKNLDSLRPFLESARDRLHKTVEAVQDGTANEDFAWAYDCLFDGLSYLTMALRSQHICRLNLRNAIERLEALYGYSESLAADGD